METKEKSKLFKFLRLDAIIEHLTGLIEARLELAKLEIREEVAKVGARIISTIVLVFLLVMIIIFLSFSIATWLNSLTDSVYLGYFIVTGFYVLVLVLLIIFNVRIRLQQKIEDMLIDPEELDQNDGQGGD
jgi:Putative Actinobacterial Holin-X, holin superfamily III